MDPQKVKDYYQEIQNAIDKVGYAIQGVFPNEEGICVCYTIGLSPLLGAECIVAGPISLQILYQTLRTNIDILIENKEQLSEKEFVGGIIAFRKFKTRSNALKYLKQLENQTHAEVKVLLELMT